MGRVNRCIELLEQGQPLYYTGVTDLDYEAGRELSATWADFLMVEFEHSALDVPALYAFMRGLHSAGPTCSGHPTPPVICTLPCNGTTEAEVRANAWQIRHILSTGVHGLLLCHIREPDAVRAFVESCRYPFQTLGVGDALSEGLRGAGGQARPAEIWNLDPEPYTQRADPWPLNPAGELMLGLKIEDRAGLAHAEDLAGTPGIAFAEWGPGDMGMSFGHTSRHDPPYPPEMVRAYTTVKAACDAAAIPFLSSWNDPAMSPAEQVRFILEDLGARIISSGANGETLAAAGRARTGRTMPV